MSEDLVLKKNRESDKGLVVIPGISSGPFGSPFDEVVEELSNRYSIVRINAWEGAEDLDGMTLKELHDTVSKSCEILENSGCESTSVLGKSFGGQLALTSGLEFDSMILWAPAVGFGEENVEKWRNKALRHASSATDISIEPASLDHIDFPLLIIHGDEDDVVNVENSRKIVDNTPDSQLKVIQGSGHSFSDYEDIVAEKTVEFIQEASKDH